MRKTSSGVRFRIFGRRKEGNGFYQGQLQLSYRGSEHSDSIPVRLAILDGYEIFPRRLQLRRCSPVRQEASDESAFMFESRMIVVPDEASDVVATVENAFITNRNGGRLLKIRFENEKLQRAGNSYVVRFKIIDSRSKEEINLNSSDLLIALTLKIGHANYQLSAPITFPNL